MIDTIERALTFACALGAGLSAGVFFAFSVFIMKALADVSPSTGMTVMNSINRAAPAPLFMLALFGTAVACVVLAVVSFFDLGAPGAAYRIGGAALFVVAAVLTIVYHIPRNDALALIDPHSAHGARYWASFVVDWTRWNHVRTLTSLGGTALLILALRAG